MKQSDLINKLQKQGFQVNGDYKNSIVLKSNKSVILCHPDGNYEGVSYKNSLNEYSLSKKEITKIFVLIGVAAVYFTTDITIVNGPSMEPTLQNHTIIIKTKVPQNIESEIRRGSIVKFNDPENTRSIKRVVALPGDLIEMDLTTVKVNGIEVDFNLTDDPVRYASAVPNISPKTGKPQKVPNYRLKLKEHQYFVMGDNRTNSVDSRKYGPILGSNIVSIVMK